MPSVLITASPKPFYLHYIIVVFFFSDNLWENLRFLWMCRTKILLLNTFSLLDEATGLTVISCVLLYIICSWNCVIYVTKFIAIQLENVRKWLCLPFLRHEPTFQLLKTGVNLYQGNMISRNNSFVICLQFTCRNVQRWCCLLKIYHI
jgi:hypothetical protein